MLERERKQTIFRLLDLHTFASIHDVVEATGASEATVRRDFIELEREKRLRRVRGGVELTREQGTALRAEAPLDRRVTINEEKKRRIARLACASVEPGETIMIDGGSTTFHMAEYLATLDVTVVTNSFAIAEHLVRHSRCTVIMPEGTVDPGSQLILNTLSPDPFANYNVKKAFMGIEGITETALTNSDPLLIQMERAMIAHARELIILADETKFGKMGHLILCPIEKAARIITSLQADSLLVKALRAKGVDVVQV
ncbi:MAG TPA: DeoR/GlpR family DNA-binding transcription regulator [Spirochaetia bacterium]|nr:DeoR/GlpR family DNA-binding transcription regulator [Spirochaetia bacterium]